MLRRDKRIRLFQKKCQILTLDMGALYKSLFNLTASLASSYIKHSPCQQEVLFVLLVAAVKGASSSVGFILQHACRGKATESPKSLVFIDWGACLIQSSQQFFSVPFFFLSLSFSLNYALGTKVVD